MSPAPLHVKPALHSASSKLGSAEKVMAVIELNPDQKETVELTHAEVEVLRQIINDKVWWDQTVSRARQFGVLVGGLAATLALLAVWWPWITSIAQVVLKDVPR